MLRIRSNVCLVFAALSYNAAFAVVQVFEIKPLRAWGAVALTLASVAASIYAIAISPWYMLPFAWAFASAAWTGVSCVCSQLFGALRLAWSAELDGCIIHLCCRATWTVVFLLVEWDQARQMMLLQWAEFPSQCCIALSTVKTRSVKLHVMLAALLLNGA